MKSFLIEKGTSRLNDFTVGFFVCVQYYKARLSPVL